MLNQRARILPPYTRRVDDTRHLLSKVVVVATLVVFAMMMGFFIAIFGLRGWFIPAIPIVAMFAVALWMAPDIDPHFDKGIKRGFFLFMVVSLIWPKYIALNLPGVPWISLERLVMFVLLTIALLQIATSLRMRTEIADILKSHQLIMRMFLGWIVLHLLMSAASGFSNISRDINDHIMWHLPFLLSAWIMSQPGNSEKFLKLMLIFALVITAVVIPEVRMGKPMWTDYIPPYLLAEEFYNSIIADGAQRFGEYRAKSVFSVTVVFAEFIGMAGPFVLFAIFHAKTWWRAGLGAALFALLFTAAWYTNSRTALAVFVVAIPAFMLMWAVRRYRIEARNNDLLGTAVLWAYPAFAAFVAAAVLLVPRIRVRVLGGSGTQNSNDARSAQWDMAIPQIIKNPLGYGSGTVSERVPYTNLGGHFTIDAYPINLLIEYGVLGFLLFAGFFITAVWVGARCYLKADNREDMVAGAAALAILSFLVSRTILSSEGGVALAFVLAGLIIATYWRQKQRAPTSLPKVQVSPAYPFPPRQIGRPAQQL